MTYCKQCNFVVQFSCEPEQNNKHMKGGKPMHKSDKELAIDVAIAYIQSVNNGKLVTGATKEPLPLKNANNIITSVYKTLTSLSNAE